MARLTASREIDAQPDALWSVLRDIGSVGKINPMVKSASASCDGEASVGDTRVCKLRGGMRVEERVNSMVPNKSIEILIVGGNMPIKRGRGEFTLEQIAPGRTRVELEIEMSPRGGPFAPLIGLMMRPMLTKMARGTLAGLEREALAGSRTAQRSAVPEVA